MHMRQAARHRMGLDGVALAVARVVGLVVADHEIARLPSLAMSGFAIRRVLVPEHAEMPGPLDAAHHAA